MNCDRVRPDLGAYVLGMLDDDEFAAIQIHLDSCIECQEEANSLAVVPDLLGRLTAEEAGAALAGASSVPVTGSDPALLDRLLLAVAAEREVADERQAAQREADEHQAAQRRAAPSRRWRRILVAAAAVAILGGGGAAAGVLHDQGSQARPTVTRSLAATDPATGVGMDVVANATSWGTSLHVQLTGVPRGEQCLLYVVTADGVRSQVASWEAIYGGPVDVTATTSVPIAKVTSFVVTTGGGDHLVTVSAS